MVRQLVESKMAPSHRGDEWQVKWMLRYMGSVTVPSKNETMYDSTPNSESDKLTAFST
jgi:hypothetical protein